MKRYEAPHSAESRIKVYVADHLRMGRRRRQKIILAQSVGYPKK
jgi:hypothetical protein